MFAVPGLDGPVAVLLVSAGAVAGLVAAALFARVAGSSPAVLVSAACVAAAVAAAPFGAWRIVEDLRVTTKLERPVAERIAAYQYYMDGSLYDRVSAAIPPGDTYFIEATEEVPDEASRLVFRRFGLSWLLPRRAVVRPETADWLVIWGRDPRLSGVPVEQVRIVAAARNGFPETYVARVAR